MTAGIGDGGQRRERLARKECRSDTQFRTVIRHVQPVTLPSSCATQSRPNLIILPGGRSFLAQSNAMKRMQPARNREPDESTSLETKLSPELEPWASLTPSLGVTFSSRASAEWRPEALSVEVRATILSGLEARATIRRRYSEIDSALYDLLRTLTPQPEYRGLERSQTGGLMAKVTELGAALKGSKSLSEYIGFLDAFTTQLDGLAADLPLLAHGFVDVREDRGNVTFHFELWGSRRSWTASQLNDFAGALDKVAEAAHDQLRMISVAI